VTIAFVHIFISFLKTFSVDAEDLKNLSLPITALANEKSKMQKVRIIMFHFIV